MKYCIKDDAFHTVETEQFITIGHVYEYCHFGTCWENIHLFKQIDTEDVLYIKMCVWGSLGVMLVPDFSLNCCCFYMAYKLSKVIS